jgi:hypothetical protein
MGLLVAAAGFAHGLIDATMEANPHIAGLDVTNVGF